MHARTGRISFSPDKADEVISHVRDTIVPKYEDRDGFKGFTLLLDRSSGTGIGISFWESEAALSATDDLGDQARRGAAEVGSGEEHGSERYEVAVDTMA
jgi:heme-degrading monooxygenase HmoA